MLPYQAAKAILTFRALKSFLAERKHSIALYLLLGYQNHNYIRPHEALNGKTPSETCEITIEGKNKWITLIQNAST